MKNQKKTPPKKQAAATAPERTPAKSTASKNTPPWRDVLDNWLRGRAKWVGGALVLLWIVIRVVYFNQLTTSPVYQMYRWEESDNAFFDEWARYLAGGDWLNRQSLHPYHSWHRDMAEYYFQLHPDKLQQILDANPNRDSTFVPGKTLWNEWYGGNTYHQEPLYPYVLAVFYKLTGNGVYWMLALQSLLGVLCGVFLCLLARRYFGETTAVLTGLLYAFCGIAIFQEGLLLRSSWTAFFAVLSLWMLERAFARGTWRAFLAAGLTLGGAFLLQSSFALFILGALALYFWQERKRPKVFARNTVLLLAGFFIAFSPVVIRNAMVGAPLFSSSSVGPVTYIAANAYGLKSVGMWSPEKEICTEIVGRSGVSMRKAVIETLQSHPSIGTYLNTLKIKGLALISGLEWPSNENYYFYKNYLPALDNLFVNFYWIMAPGLAGIMFALYYRKRVSLAVLAVLAQIAILLIFYVVGRLRVPLAVLLLPFAAYAFTECLRFTNWKEYAGKIAVIGALCYLMIYRIYPVDITMLRRADLNTLYELVYLPEIEKYANAQPPQPDKALVAFKDFMRFEPAFVKQANKSRILNRKSDIEILSFFASLYGMQAALHDMAGEKDMAKMKADRSAEFKLVVENSRKNLK